MAWPDLPLLLLKTTTTQINRSLQPATPPSLKDVLCGPWVNHRRSLFYPRRVRWCLKVDRRWEWLLCALCSFYALLFTQAIR